MAAMRRLAPLVLALALLQRLPQQARALAAWEKAWTAPNPPPAPGNLTATAPANRQSHGMALWGANEMVVHGGVGAERAGLSDLWTFNLETRAWAPVGQGAQVYFRAAHSFFVVPGADAGGLYMWGGRDMPNGDASAGSTAATNVLLKFTPATAGSLQDGGAWEAVPATGADADGAVPDGRCDHTGELYRDPATGAPSLLVYGGRVIEANDNSIARLVFGDVWSLDLASKQWTLLSAGTAADTKDKSQPPPRFLHASALVNATTLAVFGGLTFFGSSLFALDDVWLFEIPTRTWRQHKMEVPLLRSALPMALSTIGAPPPDAAPGANANDPAALVQVPALCAFGGYVIYTNAGLAVVYNDLLVWNPVKAYWEKFALDKSLPAPQPRFDHRGVLWKGTTLVFYGGSYQSVNDVGDVWMLDTAAIEPQQLVKAPAEGINALFYGRLLFIFASLLTLCFFSLCFSLRMRMNIMQRARLAEQQQQQQAQLAAAGMAGPNGALGAAVRAERERQTEEALRLLPVIPYQRPAARRSTGTGASGASGANGVANGATGAGAEGGAGAASSSQQQDEEEDDEEEDRNDTCAICLSTYEQGEPLRCLPCGHLFHRDCCDQWLRTSLSCPLCKHSASPHITQLSSTSDASDTGLLAPGSPSSQQQQQPPPPQQQPQPRVMNLFSALNPFRSGSTPRNGGGGGGGSNTTRVSPSAGAATGAPTAPTSSSAGGVVGSSSAAATAAAAAAAAAAPPQTTLTFFPVPQPGPGGASGGGATAVTGGGDAGLEGEGVLNTPYTEMQDLVAASPPPAPAPAPFAVTAVAAAPAPASPARIGGAGAGAPGNMEEGRAGDRREGGGGAAGSGGAAGGTVSLV